MIACVNGLLKFLDQGPKSLLEIQKEFSTKSGSELSLLKVKLNVLREQRIISKINNKWQKVLDKY